MRRYNDLSGKRFDRLVVIERVKRQTTSYIIWKCQCDCGNITYVVAGSLISGRTKSCGCLKKEILKNNFKDLTGQRFYMLLALEHTDKRDGSSVVWKCRCDCGNIVYASSNSLCNGSIKSCGCYKVICNITHGLSGTKEYYSFKAKERMEKEKAYDIKWTYKLEIELRKFQSSCVICGITENEHQQKYGRILEVDHVYPISRGYGLKPGNAVILCRRHNTYKKNKFLEDLPDEMRIPILKAAQEFKDHCIEIGLWEENNNS